MDLNQIYTVLDITFQTLYEHMDKDGLHFEKDVLQPNKVKLTPEEGERIWDVLMASGLADSIIGFGNGGKLEITPAGIQMMTRYGSYKNYIASQQSGVQPSQVTIQLERPDNQAKTKSGASKSPPKPVKIKKPVPAKRSGKSSK